MKRIIVSTVFVLLLIPNIMCITAFIRIGGLSRQVQELAARLDGTAVETSAAVREIDGTGMQNGYDLAVTDGAVYTVDQEDILSAQQNMGYTDDTEGYGGISRVCLTFDDGPSANTDMILDILANYNVKATFFVNGKPGFEEQYRRIVDEGHTLAMHSYSHKYQEIYSDLDSFEEDFFEIQSYLMDVTGVQCGYYRFPGGSSNTVCRVDMQECIKFLGDQNIVYFDWNVYSGDATRDYISANQIVSNVMVPIEYNDWNTYVVLMHDAVGKETTVEALPIIIERLQAMENVEIVPISEAVHTVQHIQPAEENSTED